VCVDLKPCAQLADGSEVECDVVVTATGLKLTPTPGKCTITVDGKEVKMADQVTELYYFVCKCVEYMICLIYVNG